MVVIMPGEKDPKSNVKSGKTSPNTVTFDDSYQAMDAKGKLGQHKATTSSPDVKIHDENEIDLKLRQRALCEKLSDYYTQADKIDAVPANHKHSPRDYMPPDFEMANKPCEEKAVLTRAEAETLQFTDPKKNQTVSLFDYFISTIKEEQTKRLETTREELQFQLKQLGTLIQKLQSCEPQTDIKKLVRQGLNQIELKYSHHGSNSDILWNDIRQSLNTELGFQPAFERSNDYTRIIKPTVSSGFFKKKQAEQDIYGHLADQYANERLNDHHMKVEKKVEALIEKQNHIEESHSRGFGKG